MNRRLHGTLAHNNKNVVQEARTLYQDPLFFGEHSWGSHRLPPSHTTTNLVANISQVSYLGILKASEFQQVVVIHAIIVI